MVNFLNYTREFKVSFTGIVTYDASSWTTVDGCGDVKEFSAFTKDIAGFDFDQFLCDFLNEKEVVGNTYFAYCDDCDDELFTSGINVDYEIDGRPYMMSFFVSINDVIVLGSDLCDLFTSVSY